VLDTDVVRKELAGEALLGQSENKEEFGQGIYSAKWTEQTYGKLFEKARQHLMHGRSVILDGSFAQKAHRKMAMNLAQEQSAEYVVVECILNEAENIRRLVERERKGISVSDGRKDLLPRQKEKFEAIHEFHGDRHIKLKTDRSVDKLVQQLLRYPVLTIPPPLLSMA